ncbi:hypothetical protein BH11BAC2_BH11BAC2_23550 [soil metagenome]
MSPKNEPPDQGSRLSERDNEIIVLILKGDRAKTVADQMGISLERVRQILEREGISYKKIRKTHKDTEFDRLLQKAEEIALTLQRVPFYEDLKNEGLDVSMVAYRKLRDKMIGKGHDPAPRGRRKVTKDFLLQDLKSLYRKLGRLPSGEDLNKYASFSRHTYHAHFGSLRQAFLEAGLTN